VFLAEIGDKTMLSTAIFAVNTRKHVLVLLTSTLAFTLSNTIIALAGYFVRGLVDLNLLQVVAGLILVVAGFWVVLSREELHVEFSSRLHLIACFTAILLMEMGDKTQLTVFSLTLVHVNPVHVLLGAVLGYLLTNTIGVIATRVVTSRVEWRRVRVPAGVFTIILGFFTALRVLLH